jgi:nitrite reductase/ring-hydroxylating ferredoxin subunit
MNEPVHPSPDVACANCGLSPDRRAFLRELAAITAGVTAALHLAPARAEALQVGLARRLTERGEEVTYAIPAEDGVTIDKPREIILARINRSVYAFGLSCPHEKTPLRWSDGTSRFQCPKHKSRFEPNGAFVDGRATRNMDRHAIRRDGDKVVVDLAKLYREDQDREAWIAAVVQL